MLHFGGIYTQKNQVYIMIDDSLGGKEYTHFYQVKLHDTINSRNNILQEIENILIFHSYHIKLDDFIVGKKNENVFDGYLGSIPNEILEQLTKKFDECLNFPFD